MSHKQDADIKAMTIVELRREIMRMRRQIRKWRDLRNNAKCWIEDNKIAFLLPERLPCWKVTIDPKKFKSNCDGYIRRQCLMSKLLPKKS